MICKNRSLLIVSIALCGMLFLFTGCPQNKAPIGEYQSISGLYAGCPGKCGGRLACEDQTVKVWGYLDVMNIYDKRQNPNETERFWITTQWDPQGFLLREFIEVYPPKDKDNAILFDKLNEPEERSIILVTGTVRGFDAPTNTSCARLIFLEIEGENSIEIK